MRLLLIEEYDPFAQWLIASLAEIDHSYQVTHVTTVQSAVHELQCNSGFDVALVESRMLQSQARQAPSGLLEGFPGLPLVVFTEELESRVIEDSIRLGARDFLYKGVYRPLAIDRALRCALERYISGEENYVLLHMLANAESRLTPVYDNRPTVAGNCATPKASAEASHARSIAHELCNELNVVALEADVIQLVVGCGESVQVDQSVARIHQKCNALANLIRRMQFPQI